MTTSTEQPTVEQLEALLDDDVPCGGILVLGMTCPTRARAVMASACCLKNPASFKCISCYSRWYARVIARGGGVHCMLCGHHTPRELVHTCYRPL